MESQSFKRVHLRRKNLRIPFPKGFQERLEGQQIVRVSRRAKYILIETHKDVLIWHLGMSGQVRIYNVGDPVAEAGKHDHVQFDLNSGATIVYTDPRRFGLMDLTQTATVHEHRLLKDLGPEPLGNEFSGPILAAALKGRRTSIKQAIMDAHLVAGVGNIYASESLFLAGISPKRSATTVQGVRAEKLAMAIKKVLQAAIEAGGSTLKDHRTTDGGLGYFQFRFAVYDRAGQACGSCDCNISATKGIQRLEQGGRSTYYCPRKQR